jgi:hypothetical protein
MPNRCHKNARWFQVGAVSSIVGMTFGVYAWIQQPIVACVLPKKLMMTKHYK